MLDAVRRKLGRKPKRYRSAFERCHYEGHIAVDYIDSWFCPRCWTGFFMGLSYNVEGDFRQEVEQGYFWNRHRAHPEKTPQWYFTKEERFVPEGMKGFLVRLESVLAGGPTTEPPAEGGPPYVYELRRKRRWGR